MTTASCETRQKSRLKKRTNVSNGVTGQIAICKDDGDIEGRIGFGKYLLYKRKIDEYELELALNFQNQEHAILGTLAVQEKYLDSRQLSVILDYQRLECGLFGEIAIELGFLCNDNVDALLEMQKEKHIRIGEVLVLFGAVSREEMEEELKKFHKLVENKTINISDSETDSEFIKLLLIDDNQDCVLLLQEELIENNGNIRFKLESAECLSTGIEHINNGDVDVILLDITLTDIQGIDTLLELKKHVPDIPIIVYSNHNDESFAVKVIQEGAQDYLVKGSVEGNVLSRSILYSIERHRMLKKLEHAREELQQSAHYDSLTGLPNRKLFYEHLSKAIARARQENKIIAVLFLDLDKFKTINDMFGHAIGDALLQCVTKRITSCIRKNDILSRQGGDEFIIILDDIGSKEYVSILAQRILATLSDVYVLKGKKLSISASIGISIYPKDSFDIDILVNKADVAMYNAKEQGGNSYKFFT
jgi:two-component system cell cycle response regulator